METATELKTNEKLKSFNLLAGVNALRYDLQLYGQVLPQTLEQVKNEHLSYITEGIDKASRTEFVFKRSGEDLIYFDDGHWRSYDDMLEAGKNAAIHDAELDSRRQFLVDWAENDIQQHERNKQLKPGQSRVWISLYPKDVEQKYGYELMRSCGLVPERQMGYLYQASCNSDGSITLSSQTIDRSDTAAAMAVMAAAERDPTLGLDELTEVYDAFLSAKNGGHFFAGRRSSERSENAWAEVLKNHDLIDYLMRGLRKLAAVSVKEEQLETETKRLIYGVWAAFSRRLNKTNAVSVETGNNVKAINYLITYARLNHEVDSAFQAFAKERRLMSGCGGSLSVFSETDLNNIESEAVHSQIFAAKFATTEVMKCVHCPLCHKQGVDALVTIKNGKKIITCSKCKQSKTYNAN
jgi:hypothetical protein